MVTWVDCLIQFKTNGEMINNFDHVNQNNVDILGALEGKNENYRTFNGKDTEREAFMSIDLVFVTCDYN